MNQLIEATLEGLIHRIETGTGDWIKDWADAGMPQNWTTKRHYHGINVLLLWAAGSKGGYPSSQWATYKQWQGAGFQVKAGEKSSTIFITKDALKRGGDPANSDDHYRLLKCAFVFNAAQLVKPPAHAPTVVLSQPERQDLAEAIIHATGARIEEGPQPLYNAARDLIMVPGIEAFTSADGYYATVFHELVHWTAHKDRLDRKTPSYSDEEIVAEMGAAFLCAETGIDQLDNNAAYIRGWLSKAPDKGRALMRAAAAASKAHEFISVPRETKEELAMAS
jgi:antirestriction protein ArdC